MKSPSLTTLAKEDVPLAAMAGAFTDGGRPRRKVSGLIATAIMVVKRVAARQGRKPEEVMRQLNQAGVVRAVGRWGMTGELTPNDFVPVIAEIFGVTITMGPIRVYPDGRMEISNSWGSWQPATDELLQSLDAMAMMKQGGVETMAELAARVILDWREQRRKP